MNKKIKIFKRVLVPMVLLSMIFIDLQFPQSSFAERVSRRRPSKSSRVSQRRPSRFSRIPQSVQSAQIPVNLALKEATRRVDYTPSDSLNRQFEEINVLKYAMIDPETGRVVFIGSYDPDYPSGPISYYDLLADALNDPYPSFSFRSEDAKPNMRKVEQVLDADMRRISTDVEYGSKWMIKTMMSIINSKDSIPEKLIFEQRMRQKMGIEPEEWMAYVNLDIKSNTTTYAQYELVENFLGKLFTSLGIEERFGRAFIVFAQAQREYKGTPNYQTTLKLCNLLHINEELQQVRSDYNTKLINDETAARRIFSLYYRTLLKGFGVSPSKVDAMADRYRDGYTFDEDLAYALEDRYQFLTKEALQKYVFQSFIFSQDFLSTMYENLPVALCGVRLYGRPANSPLTRVMFDADYAFKYITNINPETVSIPGHLSSLEFLTAEADRKGVSLPEEGDVRYWIKPGTVKMESFKDKTGVCFISADLGIGCEPLFHDSDLKGFTGSLNSYARGLTKRYDVYARLYPSLHIMREAEKIIAFARWIKKNNITVKIGEFTPVKNPVPEKVKGFFSIAYVRKEKGDTDNLFLSVDGGVVFGEKEGEGWIEVEPGVEVTSDVTRQLAASTVFAEQAAEAALDGDLEGARVLGEKSAQAMTGLIDTEQLPLISNLHPEAITPAADTPYAAQQAGALPEPPPPTPVSIGTQTIINKEAVVALDRNLKANTKARKQIISAEQLREDSPKEYQEIISSSKSLEQRSKVNLKRLKNLLAYYRGNPVYPQKLVADLRNLDPMKEQVIAIPKKDISNKAISDIKKATLKKEDLSAELKSLQTELSETRAVLLKLNRYIQQNNKLFKEWEDEVEEATKRSEIRAFNLVKDTLSDNFFDFLKVRSGNTPQEIKEIENFEKIISLKDFNDWEDIGRHSWSDIGEKIVSAVENLPLSDKLLSVVKSTRNIIDSGYDITAYFISWQRIQQGRKNADTYLLAIQKISERNRKLNTRIKDIESQLK